MKTLILSCSSHRNGNTQKLAEAYEKGCLRILICLIVVRGVY